MSNEFIESDPIETKKPISDSDRLDFLESYLSIEDISTIFGDTGFRNGGPRSIRDTLNDLMIKE